VFCDGFIWVFLRVYSSSHSGVISGIDCLFISILLGILFSQSLTLNWWA